MSNNPEQPLLNRHSLIVLAEDMEVEALSSPEIVEAYGMRYAHKLRALASHGGGVDYKALWEQVCEANIVLDSSNATLQAKCDALERDARRYRWLREQESHCRGTVSVNWNIGHDWIPMRTDELDTAIDALLDKQ